MVVTKQEFQNAINEINEAFQVIDKALADLAIRIEAVEKKPAPKSTAKKVSNGN